MEKLFKMLIATALLFTMIIPVNTFASGIQPLDMIGDDGGGTGGTGQSCTTVHNGITHYSTSGPKKHVYSGTANDITQKYYVGSKNIFDISVYCQNSMILVNYGNASGPVGLVQGTGGYVTGTYTLHGYVPSGYTYIYIQYKGANSNSTGRVTSLSAY